MDIENKIKNLKTFLTVIFILDILSFIILSKRLEVYEIIQGIITSIITYAVLMTVVTITSELDRRTNQFVEKKEPVEGKVQSPDYSKVSTRELEDLAKFYVSIYNTQSKELLAELNKRYQK